MPSPARMPSPSLPQPMGYTPMGYDELGYTSLSTQVHRGDNSHRSPGEEATDEPDYTPLVEKVTSVRVITFAEVASHTTYCLQVELSYVHAPFEVCRRFSHFVALRQLLVRKGHASVPQLPSKSLLHLRVARDLRERSLLLNEWLSALTDHTSVSTCQDFLLFVLPGSGLEDRAGYSQRASLSQLASRPQLNWLHQAHEERFDKRVGEVSSQLSALESALVDSNARASRLEAKYLRARDDRHRLAEAAARAAVAAMSLATDLEAEDEARARREVSDDAKAALGASARAALGPATLTHTASTQSASAVGAAHAHELPQPSLQPEPESADGVDAEVTGPYDETPPPGESAGRPLRWRGASSSTEPTDRARHPLAYSSRSHRPPRLPSAAASARARCGGASSYLRAHRPPRHTSTSTASPRRPSRAAASPRSRASSARLTRRRRRPAAVRGRARAGRR
ncbi:hypothetical protein T492DRAFT_999494 [Pavlovales sp. CCMP2436]|nr:hypothetical protein T492DRAFT_999494 [Pavlovales sp. CCMP2436]